MLDKFDARDNASLPPGAISRKRRKRIPPARGVAFDIYVKAITFIDKRISHSSRPIRGPLWCGNRPLVVQPETGHPAIVYRISGRATLSVPSANWELRPYRDSDAARGHFPVQFKYECNRACARITRALAETGANFRWRERVKLSAADPHSRNARFPSSRQSMLIRSSMDEISEMGVWD